MELSIEKQIIYGKKLIEQIR